jgi:hypothetical protein
MSVVLGKFLVGIALASHLGFREFREVFIMGSSGDSARTTAAIREAGAALADLRDALSDLSLALNDWLFEVDYEQRSLAEDSMRKLFERVAGIRGSSR